MTLLLVTIALAAPVDSARRELAAAVAEQRLPAHLVVDAWLEREAERRGLPITEIERQYTGRVATVERYGRLYDESMSARLGSIKQELLARRGLRYNRDAETLGHFLLEDRLQCSSGSIAVIFAWIELAQDLRARPVFVYTSGHVRPGLVVGTMLLVTEATTTDTVVHVHPLGRIEDARVTDAIADLTMRLLPGAPRWIHERVLLRDAAPTGAQPSPRGPDGSPFGFGTIDVPAGDLALPKQTPAEGEPVPYGAEPAADDEPRERTAGRHGAGPIISVQPSADGTFNLVFCEDVRPWKRQHRAELRALERDLAELYAAEELANLRVSLGGDCALVGRVPAFGFGSADAPVRLWVRERGRFRPKDEATIATVRRPERCVFSWRFCALKPPKN